MNEPRPVRSPWYPRLEARVLAVVSVAAGLSLTAVLTVTSRVVKDYALAQSTVAIGAARQAFTSLVETRATSAQKAAQLVTELPVFRETVSDAHDLPTVAAMTADYCGKLSATFCVVTDPDGGWIGRAGGPASGASSPGLTHIIDEARSGRSASDILDVDGRLFLVVAEPMRFAEEVLATFTAAFRLDDEVARELSQVTHCDVGFLCPDGRLCGTSLPARTRAALDALAPAAGRVFGSVAAPPALHTIDHTSYVSSIYPLGVGTDSSARLILLQDWTPTERALGRNRTQVLAFGLVVFAIALAGTLLFARRLARPLRDLAAAAGEVARGHWARRVPVAGAAEARTVAEAFNQMTASLSHWHEQAARRAQELHDAYSRFRAVTDSATDAIVSIDGRGRIVFWNLRAEAFFGYVERDAIGLPLDTLIPDRLQADYQRGLAALAAGAEPAWLTGPVEVTARRRDGTEFPIELSISTWHAGIDVFYTGVIRDITDRKVAADELLRREDQLRQAQKMEAVGRLAGGVAHDFNNLLTAILGSADLLLERLPAADPLRSDVTEIQKAGRSAASLTRDLLAFSRKQVLQPIALDLNDVVRSAENLLRRLIGENIDLTIELAPNLPAVQADPSQLEQVLLNLAVNARDAMSAGGHLRIATGRLAEGEGPDDAHGPATEERPVTLRVTDTGAGMTPDVRNRIFEPFFTTKSLGSGTGLGLAMVYGIVRQTGGRIWVDSTPGCGATFTVSLPASNLAAERLSVVPPAVPVPSGSTSETVLLVEDNDAVRRMAREALRRLGYAVVEAPNGAEALQIVGERLEAISVVLTDVVMPIMGGRELAARLRARRPDLKIIFTSGYANESVIEHATAELGSAFLQKPFSPTLLGRTIRDVLDARVA